MVEYQNREDIDKLLNLTDEIKYLIGYDENKILATSDDVKSAIASLNELIEDNHYTKSDVDIINDELTDNIKSVTDMVLSLLFRLGLSQDSSSNINFAIIDNHGSSEFWILGNAIYNYDSSEFYKIIVNNPSFSIRIESSGQLSVGVEDTVFDDDDTIDLKIYTWNIISVFNSTDTYGMVDGILTKLGSGGSTYVHPTTKQCNYEYVHPTTKQCNYEYVHPSTKQCNYTPDMDGYAIKKHDSTTQDYGIGTDTKYGHVKLTDSHGNSSTASSGLGVSAKALKDVFDEFYLPTKTTKNGHVHTTDDVKIAGTNYVSTNAVKTAFNICNESSNFVNSYTCTPQKIGSSSTYCYSINLGDVTYNKILGKFVILNTGNNTTVTNHSQLLVNYSYGSSSQVPISFTFYKDGVQYTGKFDKNVDIIGIVNLESNRIDIIDTGKTDDLTLVANTDVIQKGDKVYFSAKVERSGVPVKGATVEFYYDDGT